MTETTQGGNRTERTLAEVLRLPRAAQGGLGWPMDECVSGNFK